MKLKNLFLQCIIPLLLPAFAQAREKGICFTENIGQVTDQQGQPRNDIDFKMNSGGPVTLFVGSGQLHYEWVRTYRPEQQYKTNRKMAMPKTDSTTIYRMDVVLLGANKNAVVTKENEGIYTERYYLPATQFAGTVAHTFQKITYHDVYPNIDWVFYVKGSTIEYDFVVRPGGKVSDIRLQYSGADGLWRNDDGSITAITPYGHITEKAPYAYQAHNQQMISSQFQLQDDILSFSVAHHTGTLVIDPTLIWGTYFGGSDEDFAYDLVINKDGNVYMTGGTSSTNNIATTGAYQLTYAGGGNQGLLNDAFLSKFDPDGNCIWSTYYGSSDEDCAKSISTDTSGNLYIGGFTYSATGMATTGAYQQASGGSYDAFIAKFDTAGSRLWGSYFGGTGEDGSYSFGLHCDGFNNVYVTGATTSQTGIATSNGFQSAIADPFGEDAYLAKFNAAGNIQWSTYYGGTGGDDGFAVTTDTTGAVYVGGYTTSTTGIATANAAQSIFGGSYDGFLVKFDTSGDWLWGTYLGGSDIDMLTSLSCDTGLNIYAGGVTVSATGIATANAYQTTYGGGYQDGMIAKYTNGGTLSWASYFGGNSEDQVDKISWSPNGGIYISGFTGGGTNMVTSGVPQPTLGGAYDGIVSRFNADGTLNWSSYLGGADADEAFAIAADNIGYLYICGNTMSATGISTAGSWQPNFGGSNFDGFLARIKDCVPPTEPDAISGPLSICAGSVNTYSISAAPNTDYAWALPDGWQGSSDTASINATSGDNGGAVRVASINACDVSDTVSITVTVNPPPTIPQIEENNHILSTTASYFAYQWNKDGQPIAGATQPTYTPVLEGSYSVTVSTQAGCEATSDDYAYELSIRTLTEIGVQVYPNPIHDQLFMVLPFDATATLSDIIGRIVATQTFKKGKGMLSTSHLAPGTYFLKVSSADGTRSGTQKLIKGVN